MAEYHEFAEVSCERRGENALCGTRQRLCRMDRFRATKVPDSSGIPSYHAASYRPMISSAVGHRGLFCGLPEASASAAIFGRNMRKRGSSTP